jgi:hypothetical protein
MFATKITRHHITAPSHHRAITSPRQTPRNLISKLLGRRTARINFARGHKHRNHPVITTHHNCRILTVNARSHIIWLIVAMKSFNLNMQITLKSALTFAPLRLFTKQRVCDVAQTAVPHTKSRTNPIRNLAQQRGIRIVNTNQPRHA